MQNDLDANFPSSKIDILGINESAEESANDVATDGRDLPWLQDVDVNQNGQSDLWRESWDIVYRDVVILDSHNKQAGVLNLTTYDLAEHYDDLRQMLVDVATANRSPATQWQNHVEPLDVSNDGYVTPIDALLVIRKINKDGSQELPTPSGPVSSYLDSSGDGFVTSRDALLVIAHLNRLSATIADEAPNTAPSAVDNAYSVHEGGVLGVASTSGVLANDNDTDGDQLTAHVVDQPENGTLALNADGSFTYRSDASFVGIDSFSYMARDGVANSGVATVRIDVVAEQAVPDFTLADVNPLSSSEGKGISPRDYLQQVSGWYFGHST